MRPSFANNCLLSTDVDWWLSESLKSEGSMPESLIAVLQLLQVHGARGAELRSDAGIGPLGRRSDGISAAMRQAAFQRSPEP